MTSLLKIIGYICKILFCIFLLIFLIWVDIIAFGWFIENDSTLINSLISKYFSFLTLIYNFIISHINKDVIGIYINILGILLATSELIYKKTPIIIRKSKKLSYEPVKLLLKFSIGFAVLITLLELFGRDKSFAPLYFSKYGSSFEKGNFWDILSMCFSSKFIIDVIKFKIAKIIVINLTIAFVTITLIPFLTLWSVGFTGAIGLLVSVSTRICNLFKLRPVLPIAGIIISLLGIFIVII